MSLTEKGFSPSPEREDGKETKERKKIKVQIFLKRGRQGDLVGNIVTSDSDTRINEGKICLITNLRDVKAVAGQEWLAEVVRETGQPSERSGAYLVKLLEQPEYRWEIVLSDPAIFGVQRPSSRRSFGLSRYSFDDRGPQELPDDKQKELNLAEESYKRSFERLKETAARHFVPDEEIPVTGLVIPFTEESPNGQLKAEVFLKDDGVYLDGWKYLREGQFVAGFESEPRKLNALFARFGDSGKKVLDLMGVVERYGQPRVFSEKNGTFNHLKAEWSIEGVKQVFYATSAIEKAGIEPQACKDSEPRLIYSRVYQTVDIPIFGTIVTFEEAEVGYAENVFVINEGDITVSPARTSGFCPKVSKEKVEEILRQNLGVENLLAIFEQIKDKRLYIAKEELRGMLRDLNLVLDIPDDQFCLEHVVGESADKDEDGYYNTFKIDEYVVFSEQDREKLGFVDFITSHSLADRAGCQNLVGLKGSSLKQAILTGLENRVASFPERFEGFKPKIEFDSVPDEEIYGHSPYKCFSSQQPLLKINEVPEYFTFLQEVGLRITEPKRLAREAEIIRLSNEAAEKEKEEKETKVLSLEKRRELLDRLNVLLVVAKYLQLCLSAKEYEKLPVYSSSLNDSIGRLAPERVILKIEEEVAKHEERFSQIIRRPGLNTVRPVSAEAEKLKQDWYNAPLVVDTNEVARMLIEEKIISREELITQLRSSLSQSAFERKPIQVTFDKLLNEIV